MLPCFQCGPDTVPVQGGKQNRCNFCPHKNSLEITRTLSLLQRNHWEVNCSHMLFIAVEMATPTQELLSHNARFNTAFKVNCDLTVRSEWNKESCCLSQIPTVFLPRTPSSEDFPSLHVGDNYGLDSCALQRTYARTFTLWVIFKI